MVEGFPMSDAYRECSMQRMGSLIDQDGEDKIMQMGEFCQDTRMRNFQESGDAQESGSFCQSGCGLSFSTHMMLER